VATVNSAKRPTIFSTGQLIRLDLPGLGTLMFHVGCFGLWEAEVRRRDG
jgi:hypothetical protein